VAAVEDIGRVRSETLLRIAEAATDSDPHGPAKPLKAAAEKASHGADAVDALAKEYGEAEDPVVAARISEMAAEVTIALRNRAEELAFAAANSSGSPAVVPGARRLSVSVEGLRHALASDASTARMGGVAGDLAALDSPLQARLRSRASSFAAGGDGGAGDDAIDGGMALSRSTTRSLPSAAAEGGLDGAGGDEGSAEASGGVRSDGGPEGTAGLSRTQSFSLLRKALTPTLEIKR
jgi:hypothetical protein